MKYPLSVTFHNTRRSERVEEEVKEFAERLDKYHDRIQHCEVIIDKPHHHKSKGNEFHVKILLSVPGQKLVVNSTTPKHGDHTSLHVALKDAFDSARRQVKALRDKQSDRRGRATAKESRNQGPDPIVAPA